MRALHAYAKNDPSRLVVEDAPLPTLGPEMSWSGSTPVASRRASSTGTGRGSAMTAPPHAAHRSGP